MAMTNASFRGEKPKPDITRTLVHKPVDSMDCYKWPETVAFLERLGLDLELKITRISIVLEKAENVRIEMEYIPESSK